MLCLGGLYAWSFFVPLMKSELGFSNVQTQLITGLALGVFALSMTVAGKLEQIYGSRIMTAAAGLLLFFGYSLAGRSESNFWIFCLGMSFFAGMGTACAYVSCLVALAMNFPNQRVIVVGISSAGFGGGAIALTWFLNQTLAFRPTISLLDLLQLIGLLYGFICLCSFYWIHYEKQENSEIDSRVNQIENSIFSIFEKRFLCMFFTMFAGSFGGLLVLGNLKPIVLSLGFSDSLASLAISIYALGNMLGRVFWGGLADKVGVDNSLLFSFIILASSVLLISLSVHNELFILLTILGVGLGFSSNFVLFPAKTSQLFGMANFGSVYPYVFLAYGLAGITGPLIAGFLFDFMGSYQVAIYISTAIVLLGISFYWFTKKEILNKNTSQSI